MEKVFFTPCASYSESDVFNALGLLLQKMDFSIPRGKTVFIKPNLLAQNRPEQHSITHFKIIDALCAFLKGKNCSIQIGDSIAFYQKGLTRKAFETSRIDRVAKKYGARLVPLEECTLIKVTKNSTVLPELYIPEVLLEADYIINVCKLKTHAALRLTGAVKNMYGVLPGGYKQKIHIRTCNDFTLSDVFLDLHTILKPSLNIMDAVMALDGGPAANGKPFPLCTILASTNAAALDVIACSMVGYEPGDISTLKEAKRRGFISSFDSVSAVSVTGEKLPSVSCKKLIKGEFIQYRKPNMLVTDTYVKPVVKKSKCTCCGKCEIFCPTGAISAPVGTAPVINSSKCINCYYCLSACKKNAFKTRSTFKHKIIRFVRYITDI